MALTSRALPVQLHDIDDDQGSTTSQDLGALVHDSQDPSMSATADRTARSQKSRSTRTSQSASENGLMRQSAAPISLVSEAGQLVEYTPSEAQDLLHPLPVDWPKLPAALQSRDYTTTMMPAVNMASAHLELLQNLIDDCLELKMSASSQPISSRASYRDGRTNYNRRHLQFEKGDDALPSTDLVLIGIGGKADLQKQRSGRVTERDMIDDLPYLGAEQVVDEVMTLLAKLENDRRETCADYKTQQQLVKKLAGYIDDLAEKRLVTLPVAVQQEHEACARDIYELQWHISYRGRIRDRTVHRREQAEALNIKLKADIAFILDQSPMVKEKLDLESSVMNKLDHAQEETSRQLDEAVFSLNEMQKKSDEAHLKAAQERAYMSEEIASLNKELQKITDELKFVLEQHEIFVRKIAQTKDEIENIVKDTEAMTTRHAVATELEKNWEAKVNGHLEDLARLDQEQRELVEVMLKKQKVIDVRRKAQRTVENKLQTNISRLDNEYQFVHRIAQQFDMNIEDLQRRTKECEKQRAEDQKRIETIRRTYESLSNDMNIINEQFHVVDTMNNALRDKLVSEQAKIKRLEEKLMMGLANLKKLVSDEKSARAVLESNIASDKNELDKSTAEANMKKEKLKYLSNELESAVNEVLKKVEVLRNTRSDKENVLMKLKENLENCLKKHEQDNAELTRERQRLSPLENKLKNDVLTLEKQIENLKWRSEMMTKKKEDMEDSSVMMARAVSSTEQAIVELMKNLEELELRRKAAQESLDRLKNLLSDTQARNRQYEDDHTSLMKERESVLRQHIADLHAGQVTNTHLAALYRRLDNEYMVKKDKLLNLKEETLQLERSIKDTNQLQSLQLKTSGALGEYFKNRGKYMQAELNNMQSECHLDVQRVHEICDEIQTAMDGTTEFLVRAMDQSQAKIIAEEAVRYQEQAGVTV